MLKSGFELLKTRRQDDRIDVDALEAEYGFTLPPLYKLFVSTFHLGERCFHCEEFHNPTYNDTTGSVYIDYYPLSHDIRNKLDVSALYSINMVLQDWQYVFKQEYEWQEYGLLKIGDIGRGGGLHVGTRGDMQDKIYRVVWDWDEPYDLICDNIFELVRGFRAIEMEEPDKNVTYDQLYKNWGDEYWRIK